MSRAVVRRAAIHAVVLFHVLATSIWAMPVAARHWEHWGLAPVPRLHAFIQNALRPYMRLVGLGQTWKMFSRPGRQCMHLAADVTFADGSHTIWTPPVMRRLPLGERYGKERYRKWAENVVSGQQEYLWPDAARYVARHFRGHPSPAMTVDLMRRWVDLTLPASASDDRFEVPLPDRQRPHAHPESEVLLHYVVQPEDLR